MKTTIQIPPEAAALAAEAARSRDLDVSDFVAQAVRSAATRPWMKTPWMQTAGALADLREENKRIKALIAEEFRTLPSP